MYLLLLFILLTSSSNIGIVNIWYDNHTIVPHPCKTITECYSMICYVVNSNISEIVEIYFTPLVKVDCDVKWSPQSSNSSELVYLANGKNQQYVDSITCISYSSCCQKLCLLSNEPDTAKIIVAFDYGASYDCR
jgi:hypothetical protein